MTERVLLERRGRIALLTLNRPRKLNAISYAMNDRLAARLDELEDDSAIGAIVLTGAGEAFSAGADIREFAGSVALGPKRALREFVRRGQAVTARMETFGKPIVAAVNGIAFGGGCEFVEAVHLAVASDRALFAKPEIRLGMPPTFGGTQRLARLANRKRALEMLLTGEPFAPARALELGLVNRVVPHATLIDSAFALAESIVRHPAPAIAGIIAAVTRGLDGPVHEGLLVEADQFARAVETPDLRAGIDAWLTGYRPLSPKG